MARYRPAPRICTNAARTSECPLLEPHSDLLGTWAGCSNSDLVCRPLVSLCTCAVLQRYSSGSAEQSLQLVVYRILTAGSTSSRTGQHGRPHTTLRFAPRHMAVTGTGWAGQNVQLHFRVTSHSPRMIDIDVKSLFRWSRRGGSNELAAGFYLPSDRVLCPPHLSRSHEWRAGS